MKCLFAGLVLALSYSVFSFSAYAEADDEMPVIYKLPVWVDAVTEVCPWKSSSAEGYIRLIRTEKEDGRNGLYVQWIRAGIAGRPAEAVSTLAVTQLEKDYMVRMAVPEPQLSRTACHLTADAEDMMNERRYRCDLMLKGPGKLEFSAMRLYDSEVREDVRRSEEDGWVRVN